MSDIPLWSQIVIAFMSGGTIGGIAGAFSSFFASRQKLKELEFEYHHETEENYRKNIGDKVPELYIPINIELSKILNASNEYHQWNKSVDLVQAETKFRSSCEKFVSKILDIYEQGNDVYLVPKLDRQLRLLTFFIKRSLDYQEAKSVRSRIKYFYYNQMYRFKFVRPKYFNQQASISSSAFRKILHREGIKAKSLIKEIVLRYKSTNVISSSQEVKV